VQASTKVPLGKIRRPKASAQSTRQTVSLGHAVPSLPLRKGQCVDRSNAEQHKLATTCGARTANQINNMRHAMMHALPFQKISVPTEASRHGKLGDQPALKHETM
jgi:hypothetical protein